MIEDANPLTIDNAANAEIQPMTAGIHSVSGGTVSGMQKPYAVSLELFEPKALDTPVNYIFGDNKTMPLTILLLEDSKPFVIPGGATAEIVFSNLRGISISDVCQVIDKDSGELLYDIGANVLSIQGQITASVTVIDGDKRLTWQRFRFNVTAPLSGEGTLPITPPTWGETVEVTLTDHGERIVTLEDDSEDYGKRIVTLETISTALSARDAADEKMTGVCSDPADTTAKRVGIPGFVREVGTRISVLMTFGNTATTPTLNADSTGAGQIWHNGAIVTAAMIPAGYTIDVIWDSKRWQLLNPATGAKVPFAQVTEAASAAAKTATIAGFVRVTGSIVELEFTNGNSSTAATLEVTGTGAWGIRMFDDTVPVLANVRAMYRCYFVFDGEFWRLLNPATGHLNGANLARLPTNAKDAVGAIKEIYDFTMGFVLGITFGASFRGQAYTVTGTNFVFEGTVPNTLVATVVVPSANTIYAVKIGDRERTVTTGSRAGVYHLTLHDFPDKLENYTWAQIAAVAQGISDGTIITPTEYFSIGDTKDIQLTTGEILTMQIYDFKHDDIVDASNNVIGKAGITFGMKNLMAATRAINSPSSNVGGFIESQYYAWLSTTAYDSIPEDLKSQIKTINKVSEYWDGTNPITLRADRYKLFAFSRVECHGVNTGTTPGQGAKYPIFTDDSSRIKRLSNGTGNATSWWTRSMNGTGYWCSVSNVGATREITTTNAFGVCFGFCV